MAARWGWAAVLAAALFTACGGGDSAGGGGSADGGAACGTCPMGEECRNGRCERAAAVCGDGTCEGGETCGTCPADCGQCCGDGTCDAARDEGCATCPADCACTGGQSCDPQANQCRGTCAPACDGKACGDDGCGGSCGDCDAGQSCDATGHCVAAAGCGDGTCGAGEDCASCPGDCGECCGDGQCSAAQGETCGTCPRDCGECCGDGQCSADQGESCLNCPADCGGCCGDGQCNAAHHEDCASCPADCGCLAGERCDAQSATCVQACTPACDGRRCGDDGCGGSCGDCPANQVCDAGGHCGAAPDHCGDHQCDAGEDCATCPADCGQCCGNGACGAGENCATCPADCGCLGGQVCDPVARSCGAACSPNCDGRECGPDGCNGTCGPGCGNGEICRDGACVPQCEPQCDGLECGPDGCGGSCGPGCGPGGRCDEGHCCQPQCDGRECGPDGCGGLCGPGCAANELCDDGACVPRCVPQCDGRECGPDGCGGDCAPGCGMGAQCTADGQCVGGGPACMCVGNDVCLDGECRAPDLLCSAEHPDGLCVNGSACFAGACLDVGAGCSAQNSTGVCPVGQVCHGGACVDLDGAALCDDHDACTLDYFDHRRNRCAHEPQDVPCSDGNDCTTDTCQAGVCVSEHVAGCVEPPVLDPYVTPTNQVQLHLSGTKPAGSAVEINGDVAVAESPDARWSVTVNLVPGENVYRVRTLARDGESAFVEVRVVYDITPPTTSVTPGGGVFLDGVTVTAATDEPATVYYTTDGSTPDETSASFTSARAFRVFDDTTLRFRARDEAGNWEADVRTADFEITSHGNRWHDGTALPGGLVHPAVTAGNAAIYVAGGSDGLADQAGAYAYRYDEDAWVNLPALPSPRSEASAVWFGGAIYLFGGENDGAPLNGVLRLDPAADHAWVARRVMPSTRFGLVAVASGNNIYVFGGQTNGGSVLSTLEVYSPANDTWSNQVAQMPRARYGFAAVENGGNIYLIGGEDEQGTPIAVVDVYNVAQNRWTQVAPLPTPRAFLTATVNYNAGRVTGGPTGIVVAGGRVAGGAPTAVVEEYLIDRDEWRARTPLPRPRYSAGGVAVEGAGELDTRDVQGWIVGGQVGVPGGVVADQVTPSLLYYTQSFDHLRRLRDLPAGRFMHAAAALDDRIYLFGGREFQETTHGWAFDPETETFTPIADLPGAQNGLSAVTLNGEVWAIGGANAFGTAIATVRSYDPATNAWTDHRPMLTGRRDPAAVVLNGQVVVIGGDNGGAVQAVEIYDPVADRWSNGPLLPVARTGAVAVVWHGSIYVAGGKDADGHVQSSVLRLAGNQWQPVYDGIPVTYATAALINGRLNVFAGRENGALSNRHWNLDLANPRLEYTLTPETRLLAPYDYQAAATLNGDVYLFGGNANADPGPSGLTTVEKFAGRCLNGVQDRYEGQDGQNYPDVGGGCGRIDPTVAITPGHGYGHHGGCNSWNECNDAQGCANLACAHFGYGPAVSFRQVNCSNGGVTCDIFQDNLSIDPGWHSRADCDLPLATDVVCTRPQ